MSSFEKVLQSARFQKQWGEIHSKYSARQLGFQFENGFQILEDILNHADYVLNEDCFLFKKGEQLRRSYQGRNQGKRFSSLDAYSRELIRSEVLHQGASLKIDQAGRFSPVVNKMIQKLSDMMGVAVSCNLYFTPAFSKCFAPHTDPYHIFVLQLAGKKYWNIKKPSNSLQDQKTSSPGNASFDFADTLKEGDLLYLPQGALHEAYTKEQLSLHLTFGLHPIPLNHHLAATFDNSNGSALAQMSSQIFLSRNSKLFSKSRLSSKKIDELTKEFKNHLLDLQKGRPQTSSLRVQLDLGAPLQLPVDLEIYPNTIFEFRTVQKLAAVLPNETPKVHKALKSLSRKRKFFAGELTELMYPDMSWRETFQILRQLIEKSAIQMLSPKAERPLKDPFNRFGPDFKNRELYYFMGDRKSLRVFKIGEADGFLKMTSNQTKSLLQKLSEGPEILDYLSEKFQHEHRPS